VLHTNHQNCTIALPTVLALCYAYSTAAASKEKKIQVQKKRQEMGDMLWERAHKCVQVSFKLIPEDKWMCIMFWLIMMVLHGETEVLHVAFFVGLEARI
jgi:hypothetical protein